MKSNNTEVFKTIMNPSTGKMVQSGGQLGKKIIKDYKAETIYNPLTKKQVKTSGSVGKKVLGMYKAKGGESCPVGELNFEVTLCGIANLPVVKNELKNKRNRELLEKNRQMTADEKNSEHIKTVIEKYNNNNLTPVNVKKLVKTILKDIEEESTDKTIGDKIGTLFLNINANCDTYMKQACVMKQLTKFVNTHNQLKNKKISFVNGDAKQTELSIPEIYERFNSNEKKLFRETLLNLRNMKGKFIWNGDNTIGELPIVE